MKLRHLELFHDVVWYGAVVAAIFTGMVIQYNLKKAELRGEERALIGVYMHTSLKGLSEIDI